MLGPMHPSPELIEDRKPFATVTSLCPEVVLSRLVD